MPTVGVLRWSSNAFYGFKAVLWDFRSNNLVIFTADSDLPLLL